MSRITRHTVRFRCPRDCEDAHLVRFTRSWMRVEKMWNIGEASCSGREKPPKVHFKCSRCNRMIEQDYRAVEGDRELYNWLIARGMLFDSNGKRLLADAMLEVKPRQESDEEDLLEVSNPNQLP